MPKDALFFPGPNELTARAAVESFLRAAGWISTIRACGAAVKLKSVAAHRILKYSQ
jgi:hypothetical protein